MTSRADRAERWARLEHDVAQEKAAALGRAGERLESALAEAAALACALAEARSPGERERLVADYEAARQRAIAARLALVVQREAIGLRQHRIVDQHFPEPPRLGVD